MVQMKLFTKQKLSHRCRKQTDGYQRGKERRDELEDWSSHMKVKVKLFSHVQLFATPWTVAHQAPPTIGFSR